MSPSPAIHGPFTAPARWHETLEAAWGIRHPQGQNEKGRAVRETELYPPVKAFLEGQGYEVKSEIGPVDVLALRDDDPPVVVELKTGFALSLVHQAIARQSISEAVYICVPRKTGRQFLSQLKSMKTLCRRLGLGLLTVRLSTALVEVHCDPAPYRPREVKARRDRLLREFAKRSGDPNTGGATRQGLVTAYRQDAERCARVLAGNGASRGVDVARASGVVTATRLMADNHYGWFTRVARGVYDLTDKGRAATEALSVLPEKV